MKIINPSATLVDNIDPDAILKKLELCGRISHLSEPHGDPENFVRMLIKRGHESVLEHASLTFHIVCDRAIQNEFVRHRHASFTVESTRYVAYKELSFVAPSMDDDALELIEAEYCERLLHGERPEIAREMLPLCLKSEFYVTANLREWRHILKLRTSKYAHPQMRIVAGQILDTFKKFLPVIVEDINHEKIAKSDPQKVFWTR